METTTSASTLKAALDSKRKAKEVLKSERAARNFGHLERLLHDVPEAAYLLDISERAVYNRIASGELRSLKIGPRRKVPAEAIRDFINRKVAEA